MHVSCAGSKTNGGNIHVHQNTRDERFPVRFFSARSPSERSRSLALTFTLFRNMKSFARSSRFALLIFLACAISAGGCAPAAHQGITLVVSFPASADVRSGSPVECHGAQIGIVGDVEFTNDGNLRAELLLNADTAITHAMGPVAFPRRKGGDTLSPVVFSPLPKNELASFFGDDLTIIDTNYQDGECADYGRVHDPQG